MSRKAMFVILTVLVVLALTLAGCKKSATPKLEDIQAEDEAAAQMKEAEANTTAMATVAATVEATTAPTAEAPAATEAAPAATEAATPAAATTEATTVAVEATTVAVEATVAATTEPAITGVPGKHVVQAGENLFRIALRYGTTVEAIAKANGITNATLIYVGQVLTIPGASGGTPPTPPTTPAPPSGGERTHVVQPGENLFRIAMKYNYSQYYLAKYNGIANPSLIYVGQVIRIP